jgi:integrase
MRQEEICRPDWPDVDMAKRLLIIRDRKDPRAKAGNDQKVPLLNLTGYDAWEMMLQQCIITRGWGRVFPYNHRSVSAAFTRACDELKIEESAFSRSASRRYKPPVRGWAHDRKGRSCD